MSSEGTILLVRHGHTASNGEGLHVPMVGWADVPLTAQGDADAERVAARLRSERCPSFVYTSPLRRAFATARAIHEACGASLRVDADLREIHCGDADGLPLEEVQRRYPDHWRRNLEQRDPEFRWPGGECYLELRQRALAAVWRIARAHPGRRVAVVTHAGVISQVLGAIHGVSAARWEAFRARNGSITELLVLPERLVVIRFDDVPEPGEILEASGSPRSAA